MRKILTVLLAGTLLLGCAMPVYAVGYNPSPGDDPHIIIEGDEKLMLVTTPVQCTDEALHAAIQAMLTRAWAQINAADTLADLTPEVIPALEQIKAESNDPAVKALEIEDFVICDLFDVSLIKNKTEFVHSTPGQPITFSVKTSLEPGDVFLILHNYEGTGWEVLDRWDLADDGVLLIAVDSLSPFAIAVPDYYNLVIDYDGPVSPQTGDRSADAGGWTAAVFSCAAFVFVCGAAFFRKRYYR